VYYRVYTPDAAIHSKSAWDAKDQFLGRIAANSIPPPHNVGSLKRCTAHTEGLLEACGSSISLFVSPASQIPMSDTTKLAISSPELPKYSTRTLVTAFDSETPYSLVALKDAILDKSAPQHPSSFFLVYYRLFTQVGEDVSKTAFNVATPSVGRIEILRICPPHNPESVKRCIANVEGKAMYAYGNLFENITADEPLTDDLYGPLDEEGCLGSCAEWPLVLVCGKAENTKPTDA
ncbi:hypothetical protein B0H14DRAFT_2415809, partial [Mycena olivaceomarginata]